MRTIVTLLCALVPLTGSAQRFVDLAPEWGVAGTPDQKPTTAMGGGVAWLDFDDDFHLDLAVAIPGQPPRLLRQHDGALYEVGGVGAVTPPFDANGLLPVDVDGDGDDDLLLLRTGPNALLINDGTHFIDASAHTLPGESYWSVSAAAGDLDADGDDDIVIANYISWASYPSHRCQRNSVLINDGHGRFTERAEALGVTGRGCTLALALTDFDGDGLLDIAEINDYGPSVRPNALYRRSSPAAPFEDVAPAVGFDVALYGMGLATRDVNHDGALDYYTTSIGRGALLLGGGAFTDATDLYDVGERFGAGGWHVGWAATLDDLDGDGHPDLLIAGGAVTAEASLANEQVANLLVAGRASPPWLPDPDAWSLPAPADNQARGIGLADFDRDGHVDIAVAHATGRLSLYRQTPDGPGSPRVRLKPLYTGSSATGARITARCGGLIRHREITGGGTFAGAHARAVGLNLPPCNEPIDLTIRWPSGYVHATAIAEGLPSVVIAEPTWLRIEGKTIQVEPTGPDGAPLPSTTPVLISATGGTVSSTSLAAPGRWQASFEPQADQHAVTFRVTVAGETWPLRWTWRTREPVTILPRPQRLIGGEPVRLLVTCDPDQPEPTLSVGGAPSDLTSIQPDLYVHQGLVPLPEGEVTFAAQQGAVAIEQVLPIHRRVEPARSHVVVGWTSFPADRLGQEPLSVILVANDANGRPVDASNVGVRLSVAGGPPVELDLVATNDEQGLFTHPSGHIPDGASLQLYVNGPAFGPPMTFQRLDDVGDLVAAVDPATSRCSPRMSTLRADGEDVVPVTIFLRDRHGNPLPQLATPVLTGSHGLVATPMDAHFDDRSDHLVRAGTTAGEATLEVSLDGAPLGVSCPLTLLPPRRPDALSQALSTLTAAQPTLSLDTPVRIRFEPRTPGGRLAGSGLDPALLLAGATVLSPLRYVGVGAWEADIVAGASDVAEVTVRVQSPPLELSLTLPLDAPIPAAEPGAPDPPPAGADPVTPEASPPTPGGCTTGHDRSTTLPWLVFAFWWVNRRRGRIPGDA